VAGTALAFVAPMVLEILAEMSGLSPGVLEVTLALSLASYLLVLGAVWLISRAGWAPWILRFYIIYLVLSVLSSALIVVGFGLQGSAFNTLNLGEQDLALAIGVYGCNIAAGGFVFASFARIQDTLGHTGFLWTGRVLFVASVASIVPFVGGIFGLVGVALQLVSFGSLRGGRGELIAPRHA